MTDCVHSGLVGTAATDGNTLQDVMVLWTDGNRFKEQQLLHNTLIVPVMWMFFLFYVAVPPQVNSFWDVLDRYMRGYHSLLKLTELIRKNTEDPTVLSGLDKLQKTLKGTNDSSGADDDDSSSETWLITVFTQQWTTVNSYVPESLNFNPTASFGKKSPEQQKQTLAQWHQNMAPLQTSIQSLDDGPIKNGQRQSHSVLEQVSMPLPSANCSQGQLLYLTSGPLYYCPDNTLIKW